jgi:hypothetical protein
VSRATYTALATLVLIAVPATTVRAGDKATAELMFERAKAHERAGRLADACPLYEASYHADPQLGALLNTANCHELIGRTGTAWAEFREALELATRLADPRASYAERRASALEPRLARLHVTLALVDGMHVTRDGEDVTAVIDQPLIVDPGEHAIDVTRQGAQAFHTRVTAVAPETVDVVVPALAPEPVAPPRPPRIEVVTSGATPPMVRMAPSRTRKFAGAIVGGVGVVSAGVGVVFGLRAYGEWAASREAGHCDASNVCDAAGAAHAANAASAATWSNRAFVASGALVVTGVVLWLTAPDRESAPPLVPAIGPSTVGVTYSGSF